MLRDSIVAGKAAQRTEECLWQASGTWIGQIQVCVLAIADPAAQASTRGKGDAHQRIVIRAAWIIYFWYDWLVTAGLCTDSFDRSKGACGGNAQKAD